MNRKKTSSIDGMSQRSGDSPPPSVCGSAGRAASMRSVSLHDADDGTDSASVLADDFQKGFERNNNSGGGGGSGWRPPPPPPSSDGGESFAPSYRQSNVRSRDRERERSYVQDELNRKYEILYQLERLEKRGVQLPRKFTLASSLEEMQTCYDRIKREREVDNAVRFQRTWLVNCINGIEYLNGKFDPFDISLDGWGENVQENINDYNDVLEELAEKYRGRGKMAPELKLLMMVSGSAVMCHMQNKLFKNMPGAERVLQQNPELARQFAAATMNTMARDEASAGGNSNNSGGGGLASMLGSLFGGGGGAASDIGNMPLKSVRSGPPPPPQDGRRSMQGPTDVDELLMELQQQQQQQAAAAATGPAPPIQVTVHPTQVPRSLQVDDDDGDTASDISLDNLLAHGLSSMSAPQ